MLTEAEKEWLKRREETLQELGSYYCPHCEYYKEEWDAWTGHCQKVHCRKLEEGNFSRQNLLFDALKFEARVAEKLSRMDWEDVPCAHGMTLFCPKKGGKHVDCGAWCLMREARLMVEAEYGG